MNDSIIVITMGDPAGVGAEIIIKSFLDSKVKNMKLLVSGSTKILQYTAKDMKLEDKIKIKELKSIDEYSYEDNTIPVIDSYSQLPDIELGKVQKECGMASFKYLEFAIKLALDKKIKSIVTAPLNKEALALADVKFPGHTEILAHMSNVSKYAMVLCSPTLKVIHVTTHTSLLNMIQNLSKDRIRDVVHIANDFLKLLGINNPKIAVAGLNPHAGENGLFGREEIETIIPVLNELRNEGINVIGPEPPDTVFLRASKGEFDIVVAMYHDQGHIAIKMLGLESGVNVTAGLPFIRTSVDHGTAFNIVKKRIADHTSMINAIEMANILQNNNNL